MHGPGAPTRARVSADGVGGVPVIHAVRQRRPLGAQVRAPMLRQRGVEYLRRLEIGQRPRVRDAKDLRDRGLELLVVRAHVRAGQRPPPLDIGTGACALLATARRW